MRPINRKQKQEMFRKTKMKEGNIMKTRNFFKKTSIVLFATGLAIGFITTSANAQGMKKQEMQQEGTSDYSDDTNNMISSANYAAAIEARRKAFSNAEIVTVAEPVLVLERWMIDVRNFTPGITKLATKEQTNETAGKITAINLADMEACLEVATEEPLKLEAWIMDIACFPCSTKTMSTDKVMANATKAK
jgi:hypothetical protein